MQNNKENAGGFYVDDRITNACSRTGERTSPASQNKLQEYLTGEPMDNGTTLRRTLFEIGNDQAPIPENKTENGKENQIKIYQNN